MFARKSVISGTKVAVIRNILFSYNLVAVYLEDRFDKDFGGVAADR